MNPKTHCPLTPPNTVGQGLLLCIREERDFKSRAPEREGPEFLYTLYGHPDFRAAPPCPLRVTSHSAFRLTLWPTLKDGSLRSTPAPIPCQLLHKTFLLEEPPAMPNAHLAVQSDGQGQGTQAPTLRMKVS